MRPDDTGLLWEHFVLNEIHGRLQHRAVRYWRNKRGAEVDFVLGVSFVVAHDIERSYVRTYDGFKARFVSLEDLIRRLAAARL